MAESTFACTAESLTVGDPASQPRHTLGRVRITIRRVLHVEQLDRQLDPRSSCVHRCPWWKKVMAWKSMRCFCPWSPLFNIHSISNPNLGFKWLFPKRRLTDFFSHASTAQVSCCSPNGLFEGLMLREMIKK